MKTVSRMLAVVMSVLVMGFVFTACGSVEKDLIGDWTVSTINGKTCEEYAAPLGVPANQVALNLKLEKDKATMAGVKGSQEFQVSYKSNGAELMKDGNNAGSLVYDKTAQTLTMQDNSTGAIITYVFKKGTTDLTVAPTQPEQGEQGNTDESQSQEGNNQGFTGRDYGELDPEEYMTGRDYGELTQEELDELEKSTNNNNNNNNNNSNSNKKKDTLTGRDYGELDPEEYMTGRDYGELDPEEYMTGADYGEENL